MDDPHLSLAPALLDVAFPFHLVLDRDLQIVQAGSSTQQLLHRPIVGRRFSDLFDVTTPRHARTFADFANHRRALFRLQSRTMSGLVLRGQMMHDAAADLVYFVGSPWITQTSTFASLGLTLDDFAVSDAVVDYVLLLQSQESSLRDAREMAERLQRTSQQLTHQAFHDSLTGLPNRSLLHGRLQSSLDAMAADATRSSIAVLMLDLDGFKTVNDSYGHSAGDDVLRVVACRLAGLVDEGDLLARFGGDEFAFVIHASGSGHAPDTSAATGADLRADLDARAVELADRVLDVLDVPIPLPSCPAICVPLSASIGIAHPRGSEDADDLIRNADLAMYAAKAHGKARHQRFEPSMHRASVARLDLANELRHALDDGELRLVYQPVLRLRDDRIVGAEALLRWQHPTRGLLAPDAFLALAEETGLIVPIGAWVLDEACRELGRWQRGRPATCADERPLGVAVNLSGRQLGPHLVATVADALTRHGIDPASLTLEITEGLIDEEGSETHATMQALEQLGVWLSIDDFGTGHSSLGRLRDYSFDELKIDRRFVGDLDADGDTSGSTLVDTQIALARGLGIGVVAEGVETLAQLEHLRRAGCDRVQGYFIARPLAAPAIRALLADDHICLSGTGAAAS